MKVFGCYIEVERAEVDHIRRSLGNAEAVDDSFYGAISEKSSSFAPELSLSTHSDCKISIDDQDGGSSGSNIGGYVVSNSFESSVSGISLNEPVGSFLSTPFVPPNTSGEEANCELQFRRGIDQVSKNFSSENPFVNVKFENSINKWPVKSYADDSEEARMHKRQYTSHRMRGKKNRHEDMEEGRSGKQLATFEEDDDEILELFDKLFLYRPTDRILLDGVCEGLKQSKQSAERSVNAWEFSWVKKESSRKASPEVDLVTLLIRCAEAVAVDDHCTAKDLLKNIRQHSSPFGNGSQRCAHYFVYGLEARLAGSAAQMAASLDSMSPSTVDRIKASEAFLVVCPFSMAGFYLAMHHLLNLGEKATTLHIIDFGILYGFRWVEVIKQLSARPGGPPKIRITGIEDPQPGFRPAEMVEKTGRRLAKYCERFNVPFEYNGIISKKWHTIRTEELKINKNEAIAVVCMHRFEKLLIDEIDGLNLMNNPKSDVLHLVRKINPNIFIHSIVNGSYDIPLFSRRFRVALYHFSAYFDLLDANFNRENQYRLMLERHFFGKDAFNIVACEGSERVDRPETYKQWHQRTARAGFKQLPLDRKLMKELRAMVKSGFHREYLIEDDGNWMLQGWKGRTLCATCCWAPAPQP